MDKNSLTYHSELRVCGNYFDVIGACDKYSKRQGWITQEGEVMRYSSESINFNNKIKEANESKLGCLVNQGYRRV